MIEKPPLVAVPTLEMRNPSVMVTMAVPPPGIATFCMNVPSVLVMVALVFVSLVKKMSTLEVTRLSGSANKIVPACAEPKPPNNAPILIKVPMTLLFLKMQVIVQSSTCRYKFPTEVIDLPSGGKLYEKDSPLAEGKLELKYMTTREEDILMSENLITQGVVIDKLLDSLIVTQGVKQEQLVLGDKNAVLVAYARKNLGQICCFLRQ